MPMLTKILLTAEKIINNPVKWFNEQSWHIRMILILTIIPMISSVSILSYQYQLPKFSQDSQPNGISQQSINDLQEEMKRYHETEIQELILLRENISELNRLLQVTSKVENNENEKLVLGAQTLDSVNENLRQKLKAYISNNYSEDKLAQTSNTANSLAYAKIDDNTQAFTHPTITSKKILNFEQGAFYPTVSENEEWQQIELKDGSTAWIEKKYIILFPINENN